MIESLRKVGLGGQYLQWSAEGNTEGATPREFLLQAMADQYDKLSSLAKEAVDAAGPWWRDTGKGASGYTKDKYTVDLFGIRRGGSKSTGCSWYRWDENC